MTERGGASAARALFQDYRAFAGWRLPLALLLMIAGAIAEGVSILMIVPIVALAIDGADVPVQLQPLLAPTASLSEDKRLLLGLAIFIAAMALRSLLLYLRDMLMVRLQADHEASMQIRAAAALAAKGWPFASGIGQASMQSLLLTDINRAAIAVNYAQLATVALIMLLVQFALVLFLSPSMALIALAAIVAGYALSWRWVRKGRRSGIELSAAYDESTAAGFRLHAGLKASLAQGTVPQFLREYRSSLSHLVERWTEILRDAARVRAFAGIASALAASLLLLVGIRLFDLPFALLIPLLILFARMSGPAQTLQQSVQAAAAAAPALAAVERRIGPLPRRVDLRSRPRRPLEWEELRVEHASYAHQPGLGIADVSLTLRRGEWIGLGGRSGSGKTTLVDLVAGLIPPQTGSIRVDGAPLAGEVMERWRDSLAYVGQDEMLFDDSVRGNLLADGGDTPDDELWTALETVGLAERVRSLPAGIDQRVGDRGSSLSGGEKQRLVLARALLREPSLMILDEATSALDIDGEKELLLRLRALRPRPAALVVAHRSSTLACCDRRLTMKRGGLISTDPA